MKVVLLIDSGLDACEKGQHLIEVLVVALRLLSFFSSRDGSSCKSATESENKKEKNAASGSKKFFLEWGFKFFSSNGSGVRAKLSKKTTSFSKSCNQESFHKFQKSTELAFNIEKETTQKRKSFTHPSEQLTTTLTEILHDFEWQDKDDLLKSPARSRSSLRRRSKIIQVQDEDKTNMVFIFSKAPSSKMQLRRFSNKVVIDSDVFIDSFMSPDLLHEYREKLKIDINWIDFNCLQDENTPLNEETTKSLNIVKESLTKLGGDLLPKNDILRDLLLNSPHFKGLHPSVSLHSVEASLLDRLSPHQVVSSDIKSSLLLTGSHKLELTNAQLIPFTHGHEDVALESNQEKSTSTSKEGPSTVNCDSTDNLISDKMEINLQGSISASAVPEIMSNLKMHQCTMLICDNHSKISLLLNMLIRTQNLGILRITPNQEKINSHMGLLSPLTATCGHIFFLSLSQRFNMENTLLFEIDHSGKKNCESVIKQGKDVSSKEVSSKCKFNSHVLNSWHKPGCTEQLMPLIHSLKKRTESCNAPSSHIQEAMASLKKLYSKAKKQQSVLVTSTPKTEPAMTKVSGSGESDSASVSTRRLSRRSSSSLSRGRLMVDKARSASMSVAGDEESSNHSTKPASPGSRRASGSGFESLNLKSEDELIVYLHKQYSQVVGAGIAMEASIQAMVTVTCYFMSTKEHTNPQKAAVTFIHKHLVLDSTKLKEKYANKEDVEKKCEAVEYKLQVMLLLEMASLVFDSEDRHGEKLVTSVVSLLRVLSFIVGPVSLREFLANNADSYCGTLPKVLMDVFDELDLPYPPSLAKLASPSAPSTVWGANASVGSVDSFVSGPGSQPPSTSQQLSQGNKRSRLKQHPSLSDFRQKKQILVPKRVSKPVSKPVSKSEGRRSAKDKNKQRVKSTKNRHGVDYGRAKRNLFSERSKVNQASKGKDRLQLTPKRKSGKAKLLAPGTPAHKQTSERMLSRQKRLRDHLNIKPAVQVVAESPLKDEDLNASVDNRPARFILRESFYSSNSRQSRIVAKSMELAEKGESQPASSQRFLQPCRSQGSLISAVRGESPILSPKSSMMRSFLASPTSGAKSDRKKIPTTPPSHFPRRSPRKSVKKLLFHNTTQDQVEEGGRNKTPNSLDAQLVFDGENASDALPCRSPSKTQQIHREGFKTPEKRKQLPRAEWWETASCPPMQLTPTKSKGPELNFKNFFNRQDEDSSSKLYVTGAQSSSDKCPEQESFKSSPKKMEWSNSVAIKHQSGNISARLKNITSNLTVPKNILDKSARLSKANSYHSELQKKSSMNMKAKKASFGKNSSFAENKHSSNQNFSQEANDIDDGEVVLSTPKKRSHSRNVTSIHSTPGKVTFSDSCLISPPTGSGHPIMTTPQKSILKGSPAAKRQSFAQRLELIQQTEDPLVSSSTANLLLLDNQPLPAHSQNKVSTVFSIAKKTPPSCSHNMIDICGTSPKSLKSMSPKKSPYKRPKAPNFDSDSSNSNSTHVNDTQASVSTVVTAHTPSPSNKIKTPESINKWMRRKRHSSSSKVSGSSSSSISPSSSSSESQERMIVQNPKGSASNTNVHPDRAGKENSPSQAEGKYLKRNLFSSESESPALGKPPLKKTKETSSEIQDEEMPVTTVRDNKSIKMLSHTSGGFSHRPKLIQHLDRSLTLQKKSTMEGASTSNSKQSCFSPICSPSKVIRLTRQNSNFIGEGSQGFEVQSQSHHGDEIIPSVMSELKPQATESPQTKSSDAVKSPVKKSSTSTPVKKQYSPALSTSGLLQLIRSPLLEGQEKQTKPERKATRSKSRKHLDWL